MTRPSDTFISSALNRHTCAFCNKEFQSVFSEFRTFEQQIKNHYKYAHKKVYDGVYTIDHPVSKNSKKIDKIRQTGGLTGKTLLND